MPLYEYECKDCQRVFEVIHPISGPDLEYERSFSINDDDWVFGVLSERNRGNLKKVVLYHDSCKKGEFRLGELERLISAPAIKTIVRGNHDFAEREKSRLKKRSNDHWDRVGRVEAIERAEAKGLPVPREFLRRAILKKRSVSYR